MNRATLTYTQRLRAALIQNALEEGWPTEYETHVIKGYLALPLGTDLTDVESPEDGDALDEMALTPLESVALSIEYFWGHNYSGLLELQ